MKSAPASKSVIKYVPVDQIRPGSQQARRYFQPEALAELARSIGESGMVQPVVLRTRVWGYELLAGERRWRAAQLASLHEIPAVIRDDLSDTEAFVIGLIENLQRESLNSMETASGLKRLAEMFALTHEEIGERIGKSREYVSNHLRLLNLAPDVQAMVNEGLIPLSHAKILAGLELKDQRALAVAVAAAMASSPCACWKNKWPNCVTTAWCSSPAPSGPASRATGRRWSAGCPIILAIRSRSARPSPARASCG